MVLQAVWVKSLKKYRHLRAKMKPTTRLWQTVIEIEKGFSEHDRQRSGLRPPLHQMHRYRQR